MSELSEQISEAQSHAADATSALERLESVLSLASDAADSAERFEVTNLTSSLYEALSNLTRATDELPNGYTEVGSVEYQAEQADGYIDEARDDIQSVIDTLENL